MLGSRERLQPALIRLGDEALLAIDPNHPTNAATDSDTCTTSCDTSTSSVAAALGWVDAEHIQVVIDSFHDEVSWVVVLASERRAA